MKYISEKDGSPQLAVNAGMKMATGDIMGWINADDIYEPGALAAAVNAFKRCPDRDWCYGYCSIIDEHGRDMRRPVTWYKSMMGYFFSRHILLCENYINQPATFWRRELWEKTGGLSTQYLAAFDYLQWVKMAGINKAIPIHKLLARFRRHSRSISERSYEQQFDEVVDIVKKYGNGFHLFIQKLNRSKTIFIYKLLNG